MGHEVRAAITGVAYATPRCLVTSAEVEERIGQASGRLPVPAGTIARTTGIATRYMVGSGEYASVLAADAARRAMADADVAARDIDLLIFASASHDQLEPATAHIVADALGLNAPCFDAKNACNSFINGVEVAEAFIRTGRAHRALVVSGETPTLAIRWAVPTLKDLRRSFIGYTLGDLGTAAVVEAATDGRGVFYRAHHAESRHWRIVGLPGGGARHPADLDYVYLEGDGNALRDAFMALDADLVLRLFRETGTTWDDYAVVCAHQVTVPFTESLIRKVGLPRERLMTTVDRFGNVGSGTLALGLALAREQGRVRAGDRVLWIGLGAGISLATMAFVV